MKLWLIALRFFTAMSLLTGLGYTFVVTGVARVVMPAKAGGSLVLREGRIVGSEWLAQKFESPDYFWPRPSAVDYSPQPSGGSNEGPTSAKLKSLVLERKAALTESRELAGAADFPGDLLFASGSGVDPHVSPEAALFQWPRVARARNLSASQSENLRRLVEAHIEPRQWGFLGEPRVNVLKLNLEIDRLFPSPRS